MTTGTVLVGRERRRRWTTSEKLRLVEESFAPGASVAEVARRHEVHPNQLHGWRKEARSGSLSITPGPQACFSAVEIADQVALPAPLPYDRDGTGQTFLYHVRITSESGAIGKAGTTEERNLGAFVRLELPGIEGRDTSSEEEAPAEQ